MNTNENILLVLRCIMTRTNVNMLAHSNNPPDAMSHRENKANMISKKMERTRLTRRSQDTFNETTTLKVIAGDLQTLLRACCKHTTIRTNRTLS